MQLFQETVGHWSAWCASSREEEVTNAEAYTGRNNYGVRDRDSCTGVRFHGEDGAGIARAERAY